jgi:hypothetical protein
MQKEKRTGLSWRNARFDNMREGILGEDWDEVLRNKNTEEA